MGCSVLEIRFLHGGHFGPVLSHMCVGSSQTLLALFIPSVLHTSVAPCIALLGWLSSLYGSRLVL